MCVSFHETFACFRVHIPLPLLHFYAVGKIHFKKYTVACTVVITVQIFLQKERSLRKDNILIAAHSGRAFSRESRCAVYFNIFAIVFTSSLAPWKMAAFRLSYILLLLLFRETTTFFVTSLDSFRKMKTHSTHFCFFFPTTACVRILQFIITETRKYNFL